MSNSKKVKNAPETSFGTQNRMMKQNHPLFNEKQRGREQTMDLLKRNGKEQGKAKEWYDEVWKAQRDFANNDWR